MAADCAGLAFAIILASSTLFAAAKVADPAAVDANMRREVDRMLTAAWKDASIKPAPRATDAEFLRRAYLDLTGRIPRVSEVRSFLDDAAPDKRERLIDALLASPGYPTHMADVWRQILLTDTPAADDAGASDGFESWLRSAFAENRPYADVARELLLATGEANQTGPALFYTALELKPEKLAASTSRGFWESRSSARNVTIIRSTNGRSGISGAMRPFLPVCRSGRTEPCPPPMCAIATSGEVTLPNSKEVVPARFLLGKVADEKGGRTRRMLLAEWMTSASNPYFARAAVNRTWSQLFGRGIVDPPDDLRDDQPTRVPGLLNALAEYFVSTNYDVRRLFRVLATTEAYSLASVESSSQRPPELFAAMPLKVLTAEQLYTCLSLATCRPYRQDPGERRLQRGPQGDDEPVGFRQFVSRTQDGSDRIPGRHPAGAQAAQRAAGGRRDEPGAQRHSAGASRRPF